MMVRKLMMALAVGSFGLASQPLLAATLIVDGNGILTGATGVNVNGTLYDVQFVDGLVSANQTFTDSTTAMLAAQALLDQVFTAQFDTNPSLTLGCNSSPTYCFAFIPYSVSVTTVLTAYALNGDLENGAFPRQDIAADFGNVNLVSYSTNKTFQDDVVARFTLSAAGVPEPSTWAMMLLGFGAIGTAVRRARKPSNSTADGEGLRCA